MPISFSRFSNLIINAVDAMQHRGTIFLSTYQQDDLVYIRIQDTVWIQAAYFPLYF